MNKMEKYKLLKKAYRIDLNKIEEGFAYSEKFCHAETVGKAKKILLDMVRYEDMCLYDFFKCEKIELTYLNIPVFRYPESDLFEFEGEEMCKWQIERELEKRKRFAEYDAMLADENITHCYIMKRGVYYAPNCNGYTEYSIKAGVYEKSDAVRHAKSCDELTIVPIKIDEHNERILKTIEDLKTRIIEK